MITEDYVSFEVAKLLKEKGFNEECLGTYSTSDKELSISSECPYSNDLNDDMFIAAPTLQMTMKWLREVHRCHICIRMRDFPCLYEIEVWDSKTGYLIYTDFEHSFNTYEETCEVAIKHCLEILI